MTTTPFACIVDDSADFRLLLAIVFRKLMPMYPVEFFAGGVALLEALPHMSQKPSLILLDRHMPGLDGHQTLVRLKAHPDYDLIPIVMMSADASAEEVHGCYESGVNAFMMKSHDHTSLKESMSALCHYWLGFNRTSNEQ